MRKFNKRVLAAVFASVLAVTSAVPAFAAETSSVVLAYENDFDSADGLTLYGDAAIVANPDDATDSVLLVDSTSGGANGNYALVEAGALSGYDFSDGVTISMDIRPTANSSDWNYFFCLGTTASATTGGYVYVDGTIGMIARYGDPYFANYPFQGFVDGNIVNSDYAYFCSEDTANVWYNITYVFAPDNVSIYVDGVLCISYDIETLNEGASDSLTAVLALLADEADIVLGAGASRGDFENFGGYIDDVRIYASALTTDEVADVYDDLYTSDIYNAAFTMSVTNAQETTLDDGTTADAIGVAVEGTKTIALSISNSVSSTIKNITYAYASADESIATVKDGVITGVAKGETTVTVTAYGLNDAGEKVAVATATVIVKVTDPNTVTGLSAGLSSVTLAVGSTATVSPTALGEKTTSVITDDYSFTYESNNKSVATVADGVITAVAEGTATITVSVVVDGEVIASQEIAVTVTAAAATTTTTTTNNTADDGDDEDDDDDTTGTTATPTDATPTDSNSNTDGGTAQPATSGADVTTWVYAILLVGAAAAIAVIAKKKVTE